MQMVKVIVERASGNPGEVWQKVGQYQVQPCVGRRDGLECMLYMVSPQLRLRNLPMIRRQAVQGKCVSRAEPKIPLCFFLRQLGI